MGQGPAEALVFWEDPLARPPPTDRPPAPVLVAFTGGHWGDLPPVRYSPPINSLAQRTIGTNRSDSCSAQRRAKLWFLGLRPLHCAVRFSYHDHRSYPKKARSSCPVRCGSRLHLEAGQDFEVFIEDEDTITLRRISQPESGSGGSSCSPAPTHLKSPPREKDDSAPLVF